MVIFHSYVSLPEGMTPKYLKNLKHSRETMAKDGSGFSCFSRTSVPLPRHWLMSFGRAQVRIDIFCNIFCIRKKDRSKDRAIDKWANALVPPTPVNGLGHRSRCMRMCAGFFCTSWKAGVRQGGHSRPET